MREAADVAGGRAWSALAVVAMVAALLTAGSALPEPAQAHHQEAAARVAVLNRAIARQRLVATRADRTARRLAAAARAAIRTTPRQGTARSTHARNLITGRQLRAARAWRLRSARARRAIRQLAVERGALGRDTQAPQGADRALLSADGTTLWYQDAAPLAHATVSGCDGHEVAMIDGGDSTNVVLGPFPHAGSARLTSGHEEYGSIEQLDTCYPNLRGNGIAGEKVTICHATGSATNPFVTITISVRGLHGHDRHDRDIIPAPPVGCPTGSGTPPPPPFSSCTVVGAFVTLGDVDGIRVRFDEALTGVDVSAATNVECVVVRTCNDGIVESPPIRNADGSLGWVTYGDMIAWVDVRVAGAPVARRYETHAKCPWYSDPVTTIGGGTWTPLPAYPTLLEPVSDICSLASNTHAYLRSDSYRSIELRACDGFAVRMYDDPMIAVRAPNDRSWDVPTWPIGFGNGSVTLRDGTRFSWLLEGSLWTKTITVQPPGSTAAAVTAFGHDASSVLERGTPVTLTSAQVREIAGLLYACRGSIANPLSCGGPRHDNGSISMSAPLTEVPRLSTTQVPVTLAGAAIGDLVWAFVDYGGSCAPTAWDERARGRGQRDELATSGATIALHPTRSGDALLCAYASVDLRGTADWDGAATSAAIRVAASSDPTIGIGTAGEFMVGLAANVTLERADRHGRIRLYEQGTDVPCSTPASDRRLVWSGTFAAKALSWIPRVAGQRRLCATQLLTSQALVGMIDVDVRQQAVLDLGIETSDAIAGSNVEVTVRGTAPSDQLVTVTTCTPSEPGANPLPWSAPTLSGAFTYTTSVWVTGYVHAVTICAATFDAATRRISSFTWRRVALASAQSTDPALRIDVSDPFVGVDSAVVVTDAAGVHTAAWIRVVDVTQECPSERWDYEYGTVAALVMVPGRHRVCAATRSSWGERVVEFVDDPDDDEAVAVPLHDASGSLHTVAGSSGTIRRFMRTTPHAAAYGSNFHGADARLEVDAAAPSELTWTVEPGTHGCADELDPMNVFDAPDRTTIRRSTELEAGHHVVHLGGTSDPHGLTFCVQMLDDSGTMVHARTVLFPLNMTDQLPHLDAPGSVAPGESASISLTGPASGGSVAAFIHADGMRPCQTLAAEEAAVGATIIHALYVSSTPLVARTMPLLSGSWRVCAYLGDPWAAPRWFDTRVISVGASSHRPSLTLVSSGTAYARSLGPLVRSSVAAIADGRLFTTAVPASTACPSGPGARPDGSVPLTHGVSGNSLVRGTLPAPGSWRICGWQAAEAYTTPVARAETIVEVSASAATLSVAAGSPLTAGTTARLRVSGSTPISGGVEAALLDDGRSCPDTPAGAVGSGSSAAGTDVMLPPGPFDQTAQVTPRTVGTARGCAWFVDARGVVLGIGSTTLTVDAPPVTITQQQATMRAVDSVSTVVGTASWTAPAASALRAWTGVVPADRPCTDTMTTPTTATTIATLQLRRTFEIGTWRVCTAVGVSTALPPLATASMLVTVDPLELRGTTEFATTSVTATWNGTVRVQGSANTRVSIVTFLTSTSCAEALDGRTLGVSAQVVDGAFDTLAPVLVTTPGEQSLCVGGQVLGSPRHVVFGEHHISAAAPVTSLRIDAAAGSTVVEGESAPLGWLRGTTTGGLSAGTLVVPTGASCYSWYSWIRIQLDPGPVDVAIRTPTSGRAGDLRACAYAAYGNTMVLSSSVDVHVSPAVTGVVVSAAGRQVRVSGTSALARTLVVGRAPWGCSSSTDPGWIIPSARATIGPGAFSVTRQLSYAPAAGDPGCLLALDSTGTTVAAAFPFTFS